MPKQTKRVREALAKIREKTGVRRLRRWMAEAVEDADREEAGRPGAFDFWAFILALIEFIRQWFAKRKR